MQRQDRLLLFAFHGHRLHPGLLNRSPDRPSVVRVVLVAADERPDNFRRQQTDIVAQFQQPSRPVLRAAACLHTDQAWCPIGEMLHELRPRQPQVHDLARLHVDPVQLKHPFCRIHADNRPVSSLHLRLLGLASHC